MVLDPAAPRVYNKHFRTYLNQYELLQKLLAVSPDIKEIYVLKNRLGSFFRDNEGDKISPQERLNNFYLLVQHFAESSAEEMTGFAILLEKWQKEILNSFVVYKVEYEINKKNGHVRRRKRHLNSSLIENKNRVIQTLIK
ncbi:transposase [Allobaculum sp. JKK-2023]|uniref:transposase n=1 Tax=Allobaculum sp. JKK-2023 TaxID=3108943 RepID=UPI002B059819|nr:transposase [Allobaculum sp. JKK-2023]